MTPQTTRAAPPTGTHSEPDDRPPESRFDEATRTTLSLDLVFESLKNSRRRQVLRYLERTEEPASVSDLAEHVAAIENDTTVDALSSQQRKRVYVGLYQTHLPKLDDAGIVEYDGDRGTVTIGPNAPQLERYLDVAEGIDRDDDRPWPHYYLGLAVAGTVTLLLAGLVLGGALGPTSMAVGLGLVVGTAALSLVHAQATT